MNWTLSDWANAAQIASIPLVILLWYFNKDDFRRNWKRWPKWALAILTVCAAIRVWRLPWLDWTSALLRWFFHSIQVPAWLLMVAACLLILFRWLPRLA